MPTTTRCCSVLALLLALSGGAGRIGAAPAEPPPLFPAEIVWTHGAAALAAMPRLTSSAAYLPLTGDRLARHELTDGAETWIVDRAARSRPAAGGGRVYIDDGEGIAAIAETDGALAWRTPIERPLAVPLLWQDGWIIAADTDGTVLCLRAADGTILWRHALDSPLHAAPAIAGDRLFLPLAAGDVAALSLTTGEPIWDRRLGGPANDLLALADRVYVGSDDNYFYCLETASGRVVWRFRTGGDVIGRPVADERRVFVASLDNALRAFDRRSGSQQWRRALDLRPQFDLVLAADTIVVTGSTAALEAYRARDGQPAGTLPLPASAAAAPIAATAAAGAPMLIVVTTDVIKGATIAGIDAKPPAPAAAPQAGDPAPTGDAGDRGDEDR
jgi:outer membrane protein assembly factor BamB